MGTLTTRMASVAITVALVGAPALAKGRSPHANDTVGEGIALLGYDAVSYFPEGGGKPQKGSIKISTDHDGVIYRFASEEHLRTFQQNPEKYVPQYGGWCAWAVAELGKRVDVDPLSYSIHDGKLYLFYRDPGLDTRAMWEPKAGELIAKADARWPSLAR